MEVHRRDNLGAPFQLCWTRGLKMTASEKAARGGGSMGWASSWTHLGQEILDGGHGGLPGRGGRAPGAVQVVAERVAAIGAMVHALKGVGYESSAQHARAITATASAPPSYRRG